jgi:NADH dehydrogenase/NADH:ubiquinone oxidoreductase subunit G
MADPYGLIASGLPPEIAAQAQGLSKRDAIYQALLNQSMQPIQVPESKGRFQGRIHPLQGIAKLVEAYMGSRGMNENAQAYGDLAKQYQRGENSAISNYIKTRQGQPEIPSPADELGGGPGKPAVLGDPRAAVEQAMVSHYPAVKKLGELDLAHQNRQEDIRLQRELAAQQAEAMIKARQASGQQPVTVTTIADPKDQNRTVVVDARSGRVIGAGPKATDVGKLENKRQFNMQGLGAAVQEADDILNGKGGTALPTGSGVGTAVDYVASLVGMAPESAKQADRLRAIGGALTAKMPRMEGPQSDKDVALYKEMAGRVGDSTLPVERRKAALEEIKNLWSKYERLNPGAFADTSAPSSPKVIDFSTLPK